MCPVCRWVTWEAHFMWMPPAYRFVTYFKNFLRRKCWIKEIFSSNFSVQHQWTWAAAEQHHRAILKQRTHVLEPRSQKNMQQSSIIEGVGLRYTMWLAYAARLDTSACSSLPHDTLLFIFDNGRVTTREPMDVLCNIYSAFSWGLTGRVLTNS